MEILRDFHNRLIRFTDDRQEHIKTDHPEMFGQFEKIRENLLFPERVVRSRSDPAVELFYRHYNNTPVSPKYLCIVVKVLPYDAFIITAYFTDTIKKGEILWRGK
jgi:hypothetical protein